MENIEKLLKQIADLKDIIEMDDNTLKEEYRELKYHYECEQTQREFFEEQTTINFNKLVKVKDELKEEHKSYNFIIEEIKQQKTAFDKTIEDKTKSIDSLINENFKLKATHKTLQIKYNDLFEKINNEYTSKETLKRVEKEKEELTNRLNSKIEGVDIENKIVELNKKIKQLEEQLKINFYCGCLDDGEYADCASFFITCNDCGNFWKQR